MELVLAVDNGDSDGSEGDISVAVDGEMFGAMVVLLSLELNAGAVGSQGIGVGFGF